MNADPRVMEHFPATLSHAQSASLMARIEGCFEREGYGLWAVQDLDTAALAGFTGLAPVDPPLPFAPAVEVGWRLARDFWGRGMAGEAAAAAIGFAFSELGLGGVVSYTTAGNERSRRLMVRLGMTRDPAEDFLHPGLPRGDRLAPHVLYRLSASAWRAP